MVLPSPHVYVECDIPAGITLSEWRRARAAERAGRHVGIVHRILRRGAVG